VKELVRLGLDQRHLNRYPHSFSGGQRQRIGIARALALGRTSDLRRAGLGARRVGPGADPEPAQGPAKELGLTYLFISHNLAVVDYIADRIAVMCAGRIVEIAAARTVAQPGASLPTRCAASPLDRRGR
jgi:peptide/nickel transport system ATP-binding protein